MSTVMRLQPHTMGPAMDTLPADLKGGVSHGMYLMGAPAFWAGAFDGAGSVVGVIDTGIDGDHPDLVGAVIGRRDYIRDGAAPAQYHPHGTHVAGTIAARGQLRGMAPGCSLRDYRVLGVDGSGSNTAVTQAVYDAVADGCHIISMSLGSPDDDPALHEAIRYAVASGVLMDVAVGNDGANTRSYPGYYSEVVGVGAVEIEASGLILRAYFSSTNDQVDVSAPGTGVISCAPGGGYLVMSGTSMATPHVSGFAALLAQRGLARLGQRMTENSLWEGLKSSTVDIMVPGVDTGTGAGFVSAYPALPVHHRIQVTDGSPTMVVDGRQITLDVPARIEQDRFLVPFRALEEAAGNQVTWDPATLTGTANFWLVPGSEGGGTGS